MSMYRFSSTDLAAVLTLLLPFGEPLLLVVNPAHGIGFGLLSTQAKYVMSAVGWFYSGLATAKRDNLQWATADFGKASEINLRNKLAFGNRSLWK